MGAGGSSTTSRPPGTRPPYSGGRPGGSGSGPRPGGSGPRPGGSGSGPRPGGSGPRPGGPGGPRTSGPPGQQQRRPGGNSGSSSSGPPRQGPGGGYRERDGPGGRQQGPRGGRQQRDRDPGVTMNESIRCGGRAFSWGCVVLAYFVRLMPSGMQKPACLVVGKRGLPPAARSCMRHRTEGRQAPPAATQAFTSLPTSVAPALPSLQGA